MPPIQHIKLMTAASPLPAISEDGSFVEPRNAPPIPPRSVHRQPNRNFIVRPPKFNHEQSPPSYWEYDDSEHSPSLEKLAEFKRGLANNKYIAKRGGWKKLGIILGVVLVCMVGFIAGIALGLHHNHKKQTKHKSLPSIPDTSFPLGFYSINTYLASQTTDCTSNSATWRCYPYSTYAEYPTASAATFDWIISLNPQDPTKYTISSTPNYFSIDFTNLTLTLQNISQPDEHYFFQTSQQKPTKPSAQLGNQNVAATCYFNSTIFQGFLYTTIPKTYPESDINAANPNLNTAWPYAVKVEQVATSAAGTPTCLDPNGNSLGGFSVQGLGQQCSCSYLNTGT